MKRLAGKLDRVLVDAPCSGLGTLRRNPDLKFRQSPESVARADQKTGGDSACGRTLLKPGGRLVYATCSLLPEENEAIVEAFLAGDGFTLQPVAEILAQARIELARTGPNSVPYLKLSPVLHGTDGFFAAVLVKA